MSPSSPQLRGALYGLGAAVLFGLSAPVSKRLLAEVEPLMLAALLYLGGGASLALFRAATRLSGATPKEAPLARPDWPLLGGITFAGGILGPALMLTGLDRVSAVAGSLLLNLEGPFTILLALALFHEHLGRRGLAAAALIFGASVWLSVAPGELRADPVGVLCIAGACLAWAVDNNLTQRLSLKDPVAVVRAKALLAGACVVALALLRGEPVPPAPVLVAALVLGAASYGASIVLDLHALRLHGAAREAAFFATAPFIGALAAIPIAGAPLRWTDLVAGALMLAGVVLLVRERHGHAHTHEPLDHEHLHVHDAHHQHPHPEPAGAEPHSHPHRHVSLTHDHPHVPDVHHRHPHG